MNRPAVRECGIAGSLFTVHSAALSLVRKLQAEQLVLGVPAEHPEFNDLELLREQAYDTLLHAERAFWMHVRQHGCRPTLLGPG